MARYLMLHPKNKYMSGILISFEENGHESIQAYARYCSNGSIFPLPPYFPAALFAAALSLAVSVTFNPSPAASRYTLF
jgi:hypothetical protein